MDQDRKSPALKNIQGKIWLEGYQNGELRGEVFEDVPPALKRWHQNQIDIRIFSSGSILAQRLLFSSTVAGDLTKFLSGYFDTTTGPKNDPASYARIATSFDFPTTELLFIFRCHCELDAARNAGMQQCCACAPVTILSPRTITPRSQISIRVVREGTQATKTQEESFCAFVLLCSLSYLLLGRCNDIIVNSPSTVLNQWVCLQEPNEVALGQFLLRAASIPLPVELSPFFIGLISFPPVTIVPDPLIT
jgi:hypothetical protein